MCTSVLYHTTVIDVFVGSVIGNLQVVFLRLKSPFKGTESCQIRMARKVTTYQWHQPWLGRQPLLIMPLKTKILWSSACIQQTRNSRTCENFILFVQISAISVNRSTVDIFLIFLRNEPKQGSKTYQKPSARMQKVLS